MTSLEVSGKKPRLAPSQALLLKRLDDLASERGVRRGPAAIGNRWIAFCSATLKEGPTYSVFLLGSVNTTDGDVTLKLSHLTGQSLFGLLPKMS